MVERASKDDTRPLRHLVLRPHEHLADVGGAGGDEPDAGYFAVRGDGAVVGTVAVLREAHPSLPLDRAGSWRIRGMATAEGYRNRGIGAALMTAALAHVADHGGTAVWCNARVPAVAFYRRAGFATVGEGWDEPDIGPHRLMWRPIP